MTWNTDTAETIAGRFVAAASAGSAPVAFALGLRNMAIMAVLLEVGPRTTELRRLDRDHLRQQTDPCELTVDHGGARERTVTLSEATTGLLRAYLTARGTDANPALFATARPANGARLAASDITDLLHAATGGALTPLGARHFAAVWQHEVNGLSVDEIAAMFGANRRTIDAALSTTPPKAA